METKKIFSYILALSTASCNSDDSVIVADSARSKAGSSSLTNKIVDQKQPTTSPIPPQYFNGDGSLKKILSGHSEKGHRKMLIDKSKRKLGLYLGEILLKEYPVSLGFDHDEDKVREGDGRTPEGEFYVVLRLPRSKYYKALQISYPRKEDALRGLERHLIDHSQFQQINQAIDTCGSPSQETPLGGYIQIHGGGTRSRDWTLGCVALDNEAMDEVYDFAQGGCRGTRIIIQK